MNAAFVWYSINLVMFIGPRGGPMEVQTLTSLIYADLGGNLYTLSNYSFPFYFNFTTSFTQGCFLDEAKTIKTKVVLVPALNKVSIDKVAFVNLTSASDWEYDWDNTTTSL
jgi:hypothetical protein